jgi:UDP-glucose 4-epimerase
VKALVTGAAGFIGSHLTERLLRDGHEVSGVDSFSDYYARSIKDHNLSAAKKSSRFRFIEGDLNEMDLAALLNGIDAVFHLAARAGVRTSWGREFDAYLRDNVLATQKLLEATRDSNVRRVVFASSSSIYGDAERYPTPESVTPAPISPYGVSKLAAENLCRLYWRRSAVPAVSLRFFTVYGPRQRPDMAFHIFGRALLTGRPIEIYGDGTQSREFTYVDDVVDAVVLAAERGEPGAVYNVGGGSETTLLDVVSLMMQLAGREVPVLHRDSMAGDARRTAADLTLARQQLGYAPKVSLPDGLQAELDWLRGLLNRETRAGSAADLLKTGARR